MTDHRVRSILQSLANGEISVDGARDSLADVRSETIAHVDTDRLKRTFAPEVIYGAGKTPTQIARISVRLLEERQNVLVTRTNDDARQAIQEAVNAIREPSGFSVDDVTFNALARTISVAPFPTEKVGRVAVVTAGTSDLPIAEEAVVCASFFGCDVGRFVDVGVAGLHRLLALVPELGTFDVVIVVAGMDGALPSVVGGLIGAPVIAVPTSVGYGAAFHGIAPLLAALNACSAGITVVNIDNGFGAARAAHRIVAGRSTVSTS